MNACHVTFSFSLLVTRFVCLLVPDIASTAVSQAGRSTTTSIRICSSTLMASPTGPPESGKMLALEWNLDPRIDKIVLLLLLVTQRPHKSQHHS
jgi:hypothetical protein